jgi:hypothetical protein
MIKFISENKDWIFSGIGVTILIFAYVLIRNIFFKKDKATQKAEIHLHPSDESSKTDGSELIPIEKINLLSFEDIGKTLAKAPPLQKDDVKKNFRGIKVMWDGYLKTVSKKDNDIVLLRLAPGSKPEDRLSTILCEVSLNDYRELGILPEGAKIRIQGEIAKADKYDIELINVKLFFLENQ